MFAAALAAFHAAGEHLADGYSLGLGSIFAPSKDYAFFLLFWTSMGTLMVAALAVGFARALGMPWVPELLRWICPSSDRGRLIAAMLLAAAVPAVLRGLMLEGAALTDDETAYRFQAEIMAGWHLFVPSPADKLFFDNQFLVNDGRLYSQYFVGWPALMVPWVWLGAPGYANAVYSALTLPPLFLTLGQLVSRRAAGYALLLYLVSPFVHFTAATELSHTSCAMALAWTMWMALRCRDPAAGCARFVALALLFSLAVFIRPLTAVGLGTPILVFAAAPLWRAGPRRALASLLAFGVTASVGGALFLLVNRIQTGGWFLPAYARYAQYVQENDLRFTLVNPGFLESLVAYGGPGRALANMANAVVTMNHALFGWPASLLLVLFAGRGAAALFWAMAGVFLVAHCWHNSAGVDTFGPVHYYELVLPIIALSVVGLVRLDCWASRLRSCSGAPMPAAAGPLVAALVVASLVGYVPVRSGAVLRIAQHVNETAAGEPGTEHSVVFAENPYPAHCIRSFEHFRYFRPNNDPALANDVLWLNDLGDELNRRKMREFPGRIGFVQRWHECDVSLRPLGAAPGAR